MLRLRAGEEVAAFDGNGWTARAEVLSLRGGSCTLRIVRERRLARPARGFSVALALLKAPAMDLAVRACTELGAVSIAAFAAERSVPRVKGDADAKARAGRWRKIALEACRQCGRDFLPETAMLPGPDPAALLRGHDAVFVACLREGSPPLGELLARPAASAASRLLLVTGPEGDFTPAELDALIAAGALPCRLAAEVLRAETAAAAGAALLSHHLLMGLRGGQTRKMPAE